MNKNTVNKGVGKMHVTDKLLNGAIIFLLVIATITFLVTVIQVNKTLFPKNSIWSWEYYHSFINKKIQKLIIN